LADATPVTVLPRRRGKFRLLGCLALLVVALSAAVAWYMNQTDPEERQPLELAEELEPGPGWPCIRGPSLDNTSTERDLAEHWPAGGPAVVWRRNLGQGYSAFIGVGRWVYTQAQTVTGQYVVCLDAKTGTERWRHWYEWPYAHAGVYPGPRATPTWHAGRIYFASPAGLVGCLDADTGRAVWTVSLKQLGVFDHELGFGYSCSPIVDEGRLLLPVPGSKLSLVALDPESGKTLWQGGDEPASYSSAYPITLHGRRQVVVFLRNSLASFDAGTGKRLWRYTESEGYDEHAAWPIYREPHLLTAAPFRRGAMLFDLSRGEEAGSPKLLYSAAPLSNDVCSSTRVDRWVYGFDLSDVQAKVHRASRGTFRCLELTTGKETWSTDKVGQATALAADGKLILFNDRGELILARATPERYEELGRTSVFRGEICWTAPALHQGRLFLRTHSEAACLDLRSEANEEATPTLPSSRPDSTERWGSTTLLTFLVPVEREYLFDVPDQELLMRWFTVSVLGVFGVALMPLLLVRKPEWRRPVYWGSALVLGAIGTTAASHLMQTFVFTWPASLYAGYQWLLLAIAAPKYPRSWVRLRLAGCLFLALCGGYFLLCRRLSLVMEWAFLAGLLPGTVLAVPLAHVLKERRSWSLEGLAAVVGFTAYFWLTVGLLHGRQQRWW